MKKRVFLIVLDSLGIGELPDAVEYGDAGSNTLLSVSSYENFHAETLSSLGMFNIEGTPDRLSTENPIGAHGRCTEASKGKDTTTGHWEMAGIISKKPFPTFPNGFPDEILNAFQKATGRAVLCNKPYSGTAVIEDYGKQHLETGALIVYTSADSVFQIAAHEDIVSNEQLYEYCRIARGILTGDYAVGRVIARPFAGKPGEFFRTKGRHDFSLQPPEKTALDILKDSGYDVISVGKISDIFAGIGITQKVPSLSNDEGMQRISEYQNKEFTGLLFANLVDFDMLYGHRNDVPGYSHALMTFDSWLGGFLKSMTEDDLLLITSDHGCDPNTKSTDHSREYTFVLAYSKNINEGTIGTRSCFCDIGKTILENFGLKNDLPGESFYNTILKKKS